MSEFESNSNLGFRLRGRPLSLKPAGIAQREFCRQMRSKLVFDLLQATSPDIRIPAEQGLFEGI
jgi:hypothetical protein